jgi:hypothetical protein
MSDMYGSAFRAAYGDTPNSLWLAAISKLSDHDCRRGLATLAEEARAYPANLSEFVEACKPKKKGVTFYGTPVDPSTYLLDKPKTRDREFVDSILAKMRANFSG